MTFLSTDLLNTDLTICFTRTNLLKKWLFFRSLKKIPSLGSLLVVQTAMNAADKVEYTIKQAVNNMNNTVHTLPNDLKTVKQLSKNITDSIHEVIEANSNLDTVYKVIPNMNNLLNGLNQRQNLVNSSGNDLYDKIEKLKRKIANARELADRFKTGLTFFKNTTLELKNPESLPLLATSTKVSVYFRTNTSNGFLMYLGNEGKSKPPGSKAVSLHFLKSIVISFLGIWFI